MTNIRTERSSVEIALKFAQCWKYHKHHKQYLRDFVRPHYSGSVCMESVRGCVEEVRKSPSEGGMVLIMLSDSITHQCLLHHYTTSSHAAFFLGFSLNFFLIFFLPCSCPALFLTLVVVVELLNWAILGTS